MLLAFGSVSVTFGFCRATPAFAENADVIGTDFRLATDSASTQLFLLNPALLKPVGTRSAGQVTQSKRDASLSHDDDSVSSESTDESLAAAALMDLGAGAGLGVSHQILFRKTETELGSDSVRQQKREELAKVQHSAIRLIVELTEQVRAGVAIRYLYKDVAILGEPFLGPGEVTHYNTTLVGYGAGVSYFTKSAALSYTYYPPLRGKTEVYGEELIVVEPGVISLDAMLQPKERWTFGLLAQRWLNEVDDLAKGTTAADNETKISLYGLDPDQYVFPKQLFMVGFDFEVTKAFLARLSIGQETATLNYNDLLVYNRAGVNGRGKEPEIKYNRLRGAVRFTLKNNVDANIGMGFYSRSLDLPASMNGGRYKGSGRDLTASLGIGF